MPKTKTKPKAQDWSLSALSAVLDAQHQRDAKAHADFQKAIGKPHKFVRDPEAPGHGTGYWRVPGGVVAFRKYSNGYDPRSRMVYADEFIELLTAVHKLPPSPQQSLI